MSKLRLSESRIKVSIEQAHQVGHDVIKNAGCSSDLAHLITDHLIDAELCGVESHGVMRLLQYADEFQRRYLNPKAQPLITTPRPAIIEVDGQGGIGIQAMQAATEAGMNAVRQQGVVAIAVRNTGHTGRLGAFAEAAAKQGCLFIACGGGARDRWRMVAPHGGRKAVLPTNPWCLGMPGGSQGPVILDCATGQIAGGWLYAAQHAGATLPEGAIIDKAGKPTIHPADYFDDGAILPKGGVLGSGLATMGELICDAMLGPAAVECNTFILMVDTAQFREAGPLQLAAEAILDELRNCPPASGVDKVQICGERERMQRAQASALFLPAPTWKALKAAATDQEAVTDQAKGRSQTSP